VDERGRRGVGEERERVEVVRFRWRKKFECARGCRMPEDRRASRGGASASPPPPGPLPRVRCGGCRGVGGVVLHLVLCACFPAERRRLVVRGFDSPSHCIN